MTLSSRHTIHHVRKKGNSSGFVKVCGQRSVGEAHWRSGSLGGWQVTGTLKGYDQLLNLVLDEAVENLRDQDDPLKTTDQTRPLGLIVCRGTAVMLVAPTDGTEEIPNPFLQPESVAT
ncbi:unnamed protein product [Sphagnum troendelagicum]|uniref:Sm domain-containing protein n=1 Tax=Sphagnum troendelagicum TaxID=128251 RepID=A0ABP0TZX2_9BRYO|nr:hypothetical protein CY35_15G076300 [Sphagnum magellanicum]